jgi:cytochrome c biogenesis protein CcdA
MRRGGLPALLAAALSASAWAQAPGVEPETEWVFDAEAAHPGGSIRAALHVRIPPGYHVNSDEPLDEFLIPTALAVTPPAGFTVREIVYPDSILISTQFSDDRMSVFENVFAIGVALEVAEGVGPGDHAIPATLRYQACDDKYCLAPKSRELATVLRVVPVTEAIAAVESPLFDEIEFTGGAAPPPPDPTPPTPPPPPVAVAPDCDVMAEIAGFTVLGTAGGYLGRDDFLEFVEGAETGTAARNLLEGKGPLAIILLVLLGGIALNLTPCVLPLVPINLGIIGAGAQASSRARGFLLGGAYGLAMAAVYGVLGLVVILTAGTFGTINSTVWFNVAIAVLFVVLALAMFDLIQIDFSRFQGRFSVSDMAKRGTLALAFGMGAVTALLAGACVAPVVIQVIVYAGDQYARGTTLALGLPFFLGLGMALPWPLAGAGLSFLPKPGAWMVRVKQALGLFILVCAVYYGYLAWEIFDSRRVDRDAVAGAVHARLEEGWTDSICAGLATARAENRLVLVDMWATWCKNCLAMDKTTFRDEQVTARLEDYVKVKLQAEDLEASPARELLAHFEGIGLPTYAILRPAVRPE